MDFLGNPGLETPQIPQVPVTVPEYFSYYPSFSFSSSHPILNPLLSLLIESFEIERKG